MMKGKNKYTIGEFSNMTGTSIRTLHYYDEIGLLQPEKDPKSGHRIYSHQDILTLQKIITLKFLGYQLDKMKSLLLESNFTVDLNETLNLHMKMLEEEKVKIEESITAIKRVTRILEQEGEVDSNVLISVINGLQTQDIQQEWMEKHNLTKVADELATKSEEDIIALDQSFIQMSKQLKKLYGRPVDDPEVQQLVATYLEESFAFLGEDLMQELGNMDIEEMDIQELEEMAPSPFTEEEEKWLNEAMEYYMKQVEMDAENT